MNKSTINITQFKLLTGQPSIFKVYNQQVYIVFVIKFSNNCLFMGVPVGWISTVFIFYIMVYLSCHLLNDLTSMHL